MSKLDLDDVLDAIADRLADRVLARLGSAANVTRAAPVVYTTHKSGPHIPGKTRRWMLEQIKIMPGARKIGRDWEIAGLDYEAWACAEDTRRCKLATVRPRPLAHTALASSDDDAELARRAQRTLEASGYRRSK